MSLKTNTSFSHMAELFRNAQSVVVLSHHRPDGDAIGSSAAVALVLRQLGKKVLLLNQDGTPEGLKFLPGSNLVTTPEQVTEPVDADLVVAVDCATKERLGVRCLKLIENVPLWLNIDHHVSNPGYGNFHYIDSDSPATGQVLYDFLEATGLPLDTEIAKNLYVAISTDTGSFQYENVNARTYEIGAKVLNLGVNIAELNRQTYESYPRRRIELLRGLLNELEISHDGRVASWVLRRSLAERVGMLPEDAEGLIDHIRAIQGVVMAVHFEELPDQKIRLSLRSKDTKVDVAALAAKFGGGGHILAAGARVDGPIEEAKTKLFHAITEAL